MNQELLNVTPPGPSGQAIAQWYRAKALLRRRWWIPLLCVSAALCYQGYQIANTPPSYVSEAKMMVSPQVRVPETSGAIYSEDMVHFFGTQIELMTSREVKNRAAARLQARKPDLKPAPVNVQVYQKPKTSTFVLTATGAEPTYTEAFLDSMMDEFVAYKRQLRAETTDRTGTEITEQLLRVERERHEAEQKALNFKKTTNIVSATEQQNSFGSYIARLENELATKKTMLRFFEKLTPEQAINQSPEPQRYIDQNTPLPEATVPNATDSVSGLEDFGRARQSYMALQAEYKDLEKVLRPLHPKLPRLRAQMEQARRDMEIQRMQSMEMLEGRRETLQLEIENIEEALKEAKDRILSVSGQIAEGNQLDADVERLRKLYDQLVNSLQVINVSQGVDQEMISIMEHATPAVAVRENANRKMTLAGIFGLLAGGGILFIMLRLDDRVSSLGDLEQQFDEVVLGQIPREVDDPRTNHVGLLVEDDPRHVYAESFRNIRSSLVFMNVQGARPKTLLITSATPEEGKSVVSTNLAVTMAFSGSKVLLVDADLRRGVAHTIFDCPNTPGISDVLSGSVSWRAALRNTGYENLKLITRGKTPQQVGELLMSPVTSAFLAEVREHFDYIIVDSPPVLAADDTTSLAPKVDGAIFVIRSGVTSGRLARGALDALYQRQVSVLGVVLNAVDISQPHYYYYKYSGYHSRPEA